VSERLEATDEHPITGELLAYVEIPKGSRNKYEYDEGIGEVILDRFLSSSMVYPTDYGFLLGHRGRDGDPLDAMVCVSEPTFPGCVIPVKPIALFVMEDEKARTTRSSAFPPTIPAGTRPRPSPTSPRRCSARSRISSRSTSSSRARRSASRVGARWRRRST